MRHHAPTAPLLLGRQRAGCLVQRRAETRSTKIATYVAMLERGETIHPQSAR